MWEVSCFPGQPPLPSGDGSRGGAGRSRRVGLGQQVEGSQHDPRHTHMGAEDPRRPTRIRGVGRVWPSFVFLFVPPLVLHILHTRAWHKIFLWNLING